MKNKNFRVISLYSGSGGNATLYLIGGVRILVDAGKNAKTLTASLLSVGIDPGTLDAVFISHDHADHTSALEVFCKKNHMPVYLTEKSAPRVLCGGCSASALVTSAVIVPGDFSVNVGDVTVKSFRTSHDSDYSVGFTFSWVDEDGPHKLSHATDLGIVTEEVSSAMAGSDGVVLESNHDYRMLRYGPYPYELKKRIASRRGHLCNDESAAFAAALYETGTRHFLLAHLSRENNTPEVCEAAYRQTLPPPASFAVADPDLPVEMP